MSTSVAPAAPIRVAALIDTLQVSGPGRQLAALAVRLASVGVELRVITFHRSGLSRSPYLDYLDAAGVSYSVVPDAGPLDVRLVPRLRAALSECPPSIVQTHGYKAAALAFALRRIGAPWPWIAFCHGATAENRKVKFYHWLERRLIGAADQIVVMSREQQDSLSSVGEKVRVLHNAAIPLPTPPQIAGVSPEESWRLPDGTPPRAPQFGVVGRLSPEKGVDVFLHACRELVRRNMAFSAVVAGDGPERHNLERLCDDLGLRRHVRFTGGIADVQTLYACLDVLVIPSRSEGLPNVLLEALSGDLPVVATRVGAIPEVLESSAAGVLTRPGDPMALADAMVRGVALKADPASREARRVVTERFSPERRTAAHVGLYHDVLQRPRLRRAS